MGKKYFDCFLILLACQIFLVGCVSRPVARKSPVPVSNLSDWQERIFDGRTEYSMTFANAEPVIKAVSNNSASALYQMIDIDLDKTPILNWSWRVDHILGELNEKTKAGDDYAARVYIVISPSLMDIKPRSVSYVWSNTSEINSFWSSAHNDKVIMVAVRSGSAQTGLWLHEKRNVRADLKKAFGEDISSLIGFAIMTDTDNSNSAAIGYYGDIFFSEN